MSPPPDLKWVLGVSLAGAACGSGSDVGQTSQTGDPPALDGGSGGGSGAQGSAGASGAAGAAVGGSTAEPVPTGTATTTPTGTGPIGTTPPEPLAPCAPTGLSLDPDPMQPYVVGPGDVGRRVIYSWTSVAQIAELQADPTLLTRSMTADGYRGRAADWISARAATDPIAALLDVPEYQNKRFGWANPWATLMGSPGETYGTELLAIELRDEALIGHVDAATGTWTFFDVDGAPVDLATVEQSPERIAAVFFIDSTPSGGCMSTLWGDNPFREYVVVNEQMLASWSAYTTEIRDALSTSLTALQALRDGLAASTCNVDAVSAICWQDDAPLVWEAPPRDTLDRYTASLSFPTPEYLPTLQNLDALIAALQGALFDPAPLVHTYP